MSAPTDAVMDLAVHHRTHHTAQPGCDWCPEVKTARPTDRLIAARAEIEAGSEGKQEAAIHIARAQAHAILAVAEEARTANLIAALDYGALGPINSDARRAEITKRLWPTP